MLMSTRAVNDVTVGFRKRRDVFLSAVSRFVRKVMRKQGFRFYFER